MKKSLVALALTLVSTLVSAADVKVAAVQYKSKDISYNISKMSELSIDAAKNGAQLIVFPELAVSGYLSITSLNKVKENSDTVPGKATSAFGKIAQKYNTYIAYGFVERDPDTGALYNAAALVGPKGFVGKYRKNQLSIDGDTSIFTPGNIGFPVFETTIGRVALLVCYDDSQLQSMLLPALRGANILAYPTTSAYNLRSNPGSVSNHTTIGSMSTLTGWLGMDVVAADSTDAVSLIPGKMDDVVPGGSAVWDAQGKTLAAAAVTTWTDQKAIQTIYATIDINKPNPQREFWLKHRRPELYRDYNLFRPTHDDNANLKPAQVTALLVQYEPRNADIDHNYKKIDQLMSEQSQSSTFVVLPFNSFIGNAVVTKENVGKLAEPLNGKSYTLASNLAKKYRANLLFSMPESADGKYYQTAVLFDPNGQQIGLYRKSHLNDIESNWATAGDELPVFNTEFGRVAIVLNDEVRIPEITEMYEFNRANMILVPVAYNQKEYGGDVKIPKGLVPDDANKGMYIWYNMARYSQAYVLVANYVNGEHGDIGQSALYSLVPEDGYYPPKIAPRDKEMAYAVNFATNENIKLWTNQTQKIQERRWDQAMPLTLDQKSACFKEWKKNSTSPIVCKNQY
jgi:predicted amidohydrolase